MENKVIENKIQGFNGSKVKCLTKEFSFRNCLIISAILHSAIFFSFYFQHKVEEFRKKSRLISVAYKEEKKPEAPRDEPPPPPKPSLLPRTDAVVVDKLTIGGAVESMDIESFAKKPLLLTAAEVSGKGSGGGGSGSGGDIGEIVEFRAVEVQPKPVYTKAPSYPEFARKAEIEGLVTVTIVIDTAGNVVDARILKSLHQMLDEAAINAIRQWKFTPAMQRDKPVNVRMDVPIKFALEE